MKTEYLKLITRTFSADMKPQMREGVKNLYTENADFSNCFSTTWVSENPDNDQYIIEDTLADLLFTCVNHNTHFGDYSVVVSEANDGSPNPMKTYRIITISIPVE